MAELVLDISVSLDGYVAGPNADLENPLGQGGEGLHEWVFATQAWQEAHGHEGGEHNVDSELVAKLVGEASATIMGRNMYSGGDGAWEDDPRASGWWGDDPPFHHPVFVLTHHTREPLTLSDTTFTFVTDGIESALDQAKRAANGKDVALAGGASAAQQYLDAGLVDVMDLSVAPILLGGGERLFDNVGDDLHGLSLVDVVGAPGVAHLMFVR